MWKIVDDQGRLVAGPFWLRWEAREKKAELELRDLDKKYHIVNCEEEE